MEYKNHKHNLPNNISEEFNLYSKDWQIKKLGEVCLIKKGQLITENTRIDGSIPVIAGGKTPAYFHNKANRNGKTITISGSGANAGYISFHNYPIFASDCSTIEQSPNYSIEYIFFLLSFNQEKIYKMQTGGAQPHIHPKDLYPITIFLPKIEEQNNIAKVLSDADALIKNLEKLITKKKAIKQGTMQQLLTGKKRLPGFNDKWEVKKLGEMLDYEQPTKYLVKEVEYSEYHNTPVLTAGKTFVLGCTSEETGIFDNLPVIIFDDFTTASKFVNFPFKAKSSAMKMLKPRNMKINLKFLFEKMQLIEFKLSDHKRYWISEYQHINLEVPSLEEQTAIADVLADIDKEIENLERKLQKYRQLKVGMMQQLLTGKIRLVRK
jgi:type I restriction enzyme S subunit